MIGVPQYHPEDKQRRWWTVINIRFDFVAQYYFQIHHLIFCHRKTSLWAIVHYSNVILGAIESPITSLTIVYSTVYSDADQRKHSKLRVTGLRAGNSPVTGEFPAQRAGNAEDVSIWWRHHGHYDCSFNKYVIVSDTRFRHLFHQAYQSHEHGFDLAWMLVEDMISLPSVWARSLVHCALLCKEMPTCTGIIFDQEPDTPCHMEARV